MTNKFVGAKKASFKKVVVCCPGVSEERLPNWSLSSSSDGDLEPADVTPDLGMNNIPADVQTALTSKTKLRIFFENGILTMMKTFYKISL